MLESLILAVAIIGGLVYYYYLYLSWCGYSKHHPELITRKYKVSVVIAMRNEKKHIRELLTRLVNQSYSDGAFEIIIADDGSTDGSGEIVERYIEKWQNIRLVKVQRTKRLVSGKKNALQEAVQKAEGEIILITDADCQPGSDWIRSMVSCFDKDTDMVAGFSRTAVDPDDKAAGVKWFEHFDFMAMFAVAGGLIMSGKYFSCSAQNLGYRRTSWEKVGGYKKIMHLESGDDVNLMQLFRQAGMQIKFNLAYSSYMTTKSTGSWRELINQRSRWASNTSYQVGLNPEFFVYLMSVLINTFLPFMLLFINLWAGLLLILIRLIIEMSFIHKAFIRLKAEKRLWLDYPLWMLIQPIYILIVAFRGIFSVYKWK